ncbi:HAMP domain-containing histidine kinase [Halosquirtibacter laminarini]|uniref:HAMP domain-containing histidine kinase n=1 Tax=Halosquirtibacter laminarini TaxID=3374600 RepID=A0AC61NF08_9BACT|nr:HAMP domain-containing histidine kinase [Prolixibacteraceae bacterium]
MNISVIIAHDIRTPISSSVSMLEIMEYEELSSSEKVEMIQNMRKQLEKTELLVDDMLNWMNMNSGLIMIDLKRLDVVSILKSYVDSLEAYKPLNKNVCLMFESKMDTLWANVDKRVIETICRNLVMNSLKFVSNDGHVYVTVKELKGSWQLEVLDDGMGMSENQAKALMNLNNTQVRCAENGSHGIGLGLIICSSLIKLLKGKLTIETSLGKGSSFMVTFPLDQV